MTGKNTKTAIPIALWGVPIALWAGICENYKSGSPRSATGIPIALRESLRFGDQHTYFLRLQAHVDGHAKFKPILKTKQSSQPRATSPTCVSRVTWDEISLNKSLCQKISHPTKNPTKMRTDTHHTRSPTKGSCKRATNESHKNNRSEGSHVRGIPQAYRM